MAPHQQTISLVRQSWTSLNPYDNLTSIKMLIVLMAFRNMSTFAWLSTRYLQISTLRELKVVDIAAGFLQFVQQSDYGSFGEILSWTELLVSFTYVLLADYSLE